MKKKTLKNRSRHRQASEETGPTEAYLYARVSSKDQELEGFSIPAQLALLRDYAARRGIVVTAEYVDVQTAKSAGRKEFGAMLQRLAKLPKSGIVLVEKTDRLYRNPRDWVDLDDLKPILHIVKEGVILKPDSHSSEKLMHAIKVSLAKGFVDNLSEETRKGMTQKAIQGDYPSCAPLGYRNVDGANGKRTIEPDPEVAPHVVKLFERYASGQFSLKQLAARASSDGFAYRKSGDQVPTSAVHSILRSEIYNGDFVWAGKLYKGKHEPLVAKQLWLKVQALLEARNSRGSGRLKQAFAFSGLLTCAHCGCAIVGESKKGGRYTYYRCSHYKGKCPEPYVREEVLVDQFSALMGRLRFGEDVLAWVKTALLDSHADESREREDAIRRHRIEYDTLQRRVDSMYVDKLDGRIDNATFDRLAKEMRQKQDQCQAALRTLESAGREYMADGARLLDLAHRARGMFDRQPVFEKRRLLDFVLSNSTWGHGKVAASFKQPFDIMVKMNAAMSQAEHTEIGTEGRNENWLRG